MPGGFVGVGIFFVISGFLISNIILQTLKRGDVSFRTFYANRIRRIFPGLLTVLLACFVTDWLFLSPDEYAQLGKHLVGASRRIYRQVSQCSAGRNRLRQVQWDAPERLDPKAVQQLPVRHSASHAGNHRVYFLRRVFSF